MKKELHTLLDEVLKANGRGFKLMLYISNTEGTGYIVYVSDADQGFSTVGNAVYLSNDFKLATYGYDLNTLINDIKAL